MGKSSNKVGIIIISVMVVVLGIARVGRSDIEQDKQECANQLVGLATCLPYVGGQAKAPTQDCCTGLKQVLQNSRKCLCILVKDRNDPSLGLNINASLALNLPHICHSPVSVSDCLALLHLAPNSPDAKVFDDFAKGNAQSANATAPTSSSNGKPIGGGGANAKETSANSGKGKRQLITQLLNGVLIWCFVSHLLY